jgi:hypothetical protein
VRVWRQLAVVPLSIFLKTTCLRAFSFLLLSYYEPSPLKIIAQYIKWSATQSSNNNCRKAIVTPSTQSTFKFFVMVVIPFTWYKSNECFFIIELWDYNKLQLRCEKTEKSKMVLSNRKFLTYHLNELGVNPCDARARLKYLYYWKKKL